MLGIALLYSLCEGCDCSFTRGLFVCFSSKHTLAVIEQALQKMGPKGYAIKSNGNATKELSWMDRMCHKIETYCDLGEPGRGPSIIQVYYICVFHSHSFHYEFWYACKSLPCFLIGN